MDPITLVLRASKSPAASAPVGGELSAAEIDANWNNLKTACEQLDSEKLGTADAPEITATLTTLVGTDTLIVLRSGVPHLATLAAVQAFVGGAPSDTAPAAFTVGQWTATAGVESIELNITALPDDGGSAITALQYRLDGGAATALTGTGTGVRTISGLTGAVEYDVQIRAVNAIGAGEWSDVKSRTPTAAGGGAGAASWQAVAISTSSINEFQTHSPTLPAGGTASQLLVLEIVGIETGHFAGLVPPAGWTLRESYFNSAGAGANTPAGFAIYTAPGNTAAGSWSRGPGAGNLSAVWAAHLWSGVDLASPVRAYAINDSATWGSANNMPSPAVTAGEGDGVQAMLYHVQGDEVWGTPQAGYTRVVDRDSSPAAFSTLVQSDVAAGATGTIAHGATGTFESRVAYTLALRAA